MKFTFAQAFLSHDDSTVHPLVLGLLAFLCGCTYACQRESSFLSYLALAAEEIVRKGAVRSRISSSHLTRRRASTCPRGSGVQARCRAPRQQGSTRRWLLCLRAPSSTPVHIAARPAPLGAAAAIQYNMSWLAGSFATFGPASAPTHRNRCAALRMVKCRSTLSVGCQQPRHGQHSIDTQEHAQRQPDGQTVVEVEFLPFDSLLTLSCRNRSISGPAARRSIDCVMYCRPITALGRPLPKPPAAKDREQPTRFVHFAAQHSISLACSSP